MLFVLSRKDRLPLLSVDCVCLLSDLVLVVLGDGNSALPILVCLESSKDYWVWAPVSPRARAQRRAGVSPPR